MRALTGGETACPQYRAPKMARTAQKISSVPLSMDEIRFRMCSATVYEISRLGGRHRDRGRQKPSSRLSWHVLRTALSKFSARLLGKGALSQRALHFSRLR